jgi:glucosylceramidase
MDEKHDSWSRRRFVRTGAQIAAVAAALPKYEARAQLSSSEPIRDKQLTFVTTTESEAWRDGLIFKPAFNWTVLNLNIDPADAARNRAPMDGFGACFNELGWTSLQALSEKDRQAILHELFDPSAGARFRCCRMPVGANDFATEAYSYDEVDGDFSLSRFSIEHDQKTLVPFLRAALRHQPELRLWASPWTPPSWMKRNRFYAEAKGFPGQPDNGIRPDQIGHEGEDFFIQEPRYFDAYARYFGRFIDAYRAAGIRIGMVMPQNEFNSAQNFPSCTWTPEGLARFLRALGPEMDKREVAIFFGTLERGNPKFFETVMADREAARFIKGIGVQWAGKNALPALHEKFPSLPIYQSEQECGNGENHWSYTSYCWHLMKHYFGSGANGYMYWNISLLLGGRSTWGWQQNSLVTVNPADKTYRFTHDYYLLKHLSHFVDVGARFLKVSGTFDDALAFRNPDQSVIVMLRNQGAQPQRIQVDVAGRAAELEMPPDSIGTFAVRTS